MLRREGPHQVVPAFPVFPQQKETLWAASSLPVLELVVDLRLVEPVVFHGKVYGAEALVFCGEQAQLKQVFGRAGVGADGVVVGRAEFCCHGCSLGDRTAVSFHPSRGSCWLAGKVLRPRSVCLLPEEMFL